MTVELRQLRRRCMAAVSALLGIGRNDDILQAATYVCMLACMHVCKLTRVCIYVRMYLCRPIHACSKTTIVLHFGRRIPQTGGNSTPECFSNNRRRRTDSLSFFQVKKSQSHHFQHYRTQSSDLLYQNPLTSVVRRYWYLVSFVRDEEKTFVQNTEVAEAQLSYNQRHDRRMISRFKVTCFCHGNPHVTKEIQVIKWCSLEFF